MKVQELKENFNRYDLVREHLFCRLINPENNREQLSDMPEEEWMDLAKVCFCLLETEEEVTASFTVRNPYLQIWGIDREQLFRDAEANREKAPGPTLQKLDSMIPEYRECGGEQTPLYILTYPDRPYGAVSVTDGASLQAAGELFGSSFFILPSSVHECLLLPDDGSYDPAGLNRMVREINRTQLEPEEILADHIYRYDLFRRNVSVPCGIQMP